jgi:putative ABC transport system permease protein
MGRFINHIDVKERRKVCVIGKQIYETLFPDSSNPCGKFINVNGIYYQVIGVNTSSGNMSVNGWPPTTITIPFSTMQQNYNFGNKIQLLCYTARPQHSIKDIQARIEPILKKAHLIHPDDKQAVLNVNAEALFSMVDNLFKGIEILSWMVGLGTLLAGAIGVSNIMMVTVKERTTEIGIRRAIGAKPRDIMSQILSESMVLTILAGMTGISFAVFVLQMLEIGTAQSEMPANFQISFWMAIGACIILLLLGMLAGLAPAYRALAIKPIEAIRDE